MPYLSAIKHPHHSAQLIVSADKPAMQDGWLILDRSLIMMQHLWCYTLDQECFEPEMYVAVPSASVFSVVFVDCEFYSNLANNHPQHLENADD